MRATHRTVDGSRVVFDGESDLTQPATSLAALRVRRGRSQMFEGNPPGRVQALWAAAQASGLDYQVTGAKIDEVRGGHLLTTVVTHDSGSDSRRTVTLSIWESETGAVVSTTTGDNLNGFHDFVSKVPFDADEDGAFVKLRALSQPRVPRLMKRIPGRALAIVSPLIQETRAELPSGQSGARVPGGEAFRLKAGSDAVALVSESAVVHLEPQPGDDAEAAMNDLVIDWQAGD